MGYTHKDLIELGAPELPEGYYYRVGTSHYSDTHAMIEVSIRGKRRWRRNSVVTRRAVDYNLIDGTLSGHALVVNYYHTPEDAVIRFCGVVHKEFSAAMKSHEAMGRLRALAGDYKE